jgi:hypothetical protein
LSPYLLGRAEEIYRAASRNLDTYGPGYDFESALKTAESSVRIPDLLERGVLESDLAELRWRVTEAVRLVPERHRDASRQIVRQAIHEFNTHYQQYEGPAIDIVRRVRLGLLHLLDLHRVFADDSAGLVEFLGDGIAGSLSEKDLENLQEMFKVAFLVPKLPFRIEPSPDLEKASQVPSISPGIGAILQLIAGSGIIALGSLKELAELLGFEIGGKPGRPTKDYSREYDSKASGLSWTGVARQALLEDSGLRFEFGDKSFDSLNFEQQEMLKHRVRQGVTSFAKRTGKPLPPKQQAGQPALVEGSRKTN